MLDPLDDLPRPELIRRLRVNRECAERALAAAGQFRAAIDGLQAKLDTARSWAEQMVAERRQLASRVAELERLVADRDRRLDEAGGIVGAFLDGLAQEDGEEMDPFALAEGARDQLAEVLDLPPPFFGGADPSGPAGPSGPAPVTRHRCSFDFRSNAR